ncbi:nitroreductase family protein [Carboxydothermus hydrogenoformans]|uniref:Nitroreductase family protein n=1 Tax=Carboxydothermus hydrogenoformans (strain ATCC BAA-161 / DSM 6008 / Z-2901) TaxID=246194 RepID=Q3AB66_CARHZ|nr:nitroreductase family protein [Carboxydothermus hydrogenoformans]ABB14860.1 nitroreductase family protein [Carboxydothermus hydrogenoformans Z-2901]
MELKEILKGRRSIRKFKKDPVPREVVEELLEAALWAPSGKNRQPWEIYVVGGEKRDELARLIAESGKHIKPKLEELFPEKIVKITLQFFENVGDAPVIILFYIPKYEFSVNHLMSGYERHYNEENRIEAIMSVSALVENLMLLAYERGLGTCWMTGPRYVADEIDRFLGVTDKEFVCAVVLGYPDQNPPVPPRKTGKIQFIGF